MQALNGVWRASRVAGLPVVAVAVALAAPGCGEHSDEQQIRDVVEDVQAAFAEGDLDKVCGLMTNAAREHVGRVGHLRRRCQSRLSDLEWAIDNEQRLRPTPQPTVEAVAVAGERAVATLESSTGAVIRTPFRRVDGKWRINAFYGDIPAGRQVFVF